MWREVAALDYPAYGQEEEDYYGEEGLVSSSPNYNLFPADAIPDFERNPNEIRYAGDLASFEFVATGPPFLSVLIKSTIKATLAARGFTWYTIEALETPTRQVLGLNVWGNYTFRVTFHGSPIVLAAIPGFVWAILGALVIVGVTITIWSFNVASTQRSEAGKVDKTQELLDTLANAPVDAVTKAQLLKTAVTNLTGQGAPAGAPEEGGFTKTIGSLTDLAKWGLVAYVGVQVLQAFKPAGRS